MKTPKGLADRLYFIGHILHPKQRIGAITPSSEWLVGEVLSDIDWDLMRVVVELGPGTGVVTAEIVKRLRPGAKFIAIDRSKQFTEILAKRFPGVVVVNGSVDELDSICAREEVEFIDVVISGLPWSAFTIKQQEKFLRKIEKCLRPGGRFLTFVYTTSRFFPKGRPFLGFLNLIFAKVDRGRTIWRNVPPAYVYRCQKSGESKLNISDSNSYSSVD